MTTHRPYTAVRIEFVPASIQTLNMTAKRDFTIPGTNGGSITLTKGERFTAVRASSLGHDMWYIVRQVSGLKRCSCPATKPCKHEKLMTINNTTGPLVHKIAKTRVETRPYRNEQEVCVPQFKNEVGQWTDFRQKNGHAASFLTSSADQAKVFANQQIGRVMTKPEPLFRGSIEDAQKRTIIEMRTRREMEIPSELALWTREQALDEIAYLQQINHSQDMREKATLGPRRGFSLMR
jgi:hypothetical protein